MIIGIDYTAAAWQGAGIGRYTRELVRAAVALGGDYSYRLFYAAGGLPANSPYVADLRRLCARYPQVRALPIPLTPRMLTLLWQRLRAPLRIELITGRLDVVHAPDFVLPPTRARTLLTIHDLSFLIGPQWSEPSLQRYLARAVPRALRQADLIVADSYATRDDLVGLLGADGDKIAVIHLGVDQRFRPLAAAELEPVRQRLQLPQQFALFVSTLEPRKNLVRVIEGFSQLADGTWQTTTADEFQLVIVGRKGWLYGEIFDAVERLGLGGRVRFLDFLDDQDLPAVYNLARLFIYPSLYEGFGLPALEALACGTPLVTASSGSLPEVVGDAAVMVDPHESGSIAAGMARLLNDDGLAKRLRDAGPQQARAFRWERAATELLACYERLRSYDTSTRSDGGGAGTRGGARPWL